MRATVAVSTVRTTIGATIGTTATRVVGARYAGKTRKSCDLHSATLLVLTTAAFTPLLGDNPVKSKLFHVSGRDCDDDRA